MKNIKHIVVLILLLLALTAKAQITDTEISDEQIEDLSINICRSVLTFRNASAKTAGESIEYMILKFLNTSQEDPNHKAILTKFWNENNEKCICYEGPEDETRNPQHFLKRIVDLGMYKSVLNDFLLSNPFKFPIDVNAVEIYNGKEETLLDYLNEILSNPENEEKYNFQEIKSLRRLLLMGYNAKTAAQLKN
jgi:hypothetical protein